MSSLKTVYLHIGTFKTGTTSIQKYMVDHKKLHKRLGVEFYKGLYFPENHIELHLAAIRINRMCPIKYLSKLSVDAKYKIGVQSRVRDFLKKSTAKKVIFSAEGLTYLRYDDELSFLKEMFKGAEVYIIIYLRDKSSFLRSYRSQINRMGIPLSNDPNSFAYVQGDTWLLDYDKLISIYGSHFGYDRIIIIDYNDVLVSDGNVIPSFLKTIGMPKTLSDTSAYWYNKSPNK